MLNSVDFWIGYVIGGNIGVIVTYLTFRKAAIKKNVWNLIKKL